MPIKEIEKDLQRKDFVSEDRQHDKTVYDVWKSEEDNTKEASTWQKIKDTMFSARLKAITIGGIIIAVIAVLVLASASFVYFQGGFFAQDRVLLSMESPQTIDSNTLTRITFIYENDNRADLNDAQITVQFGDYFVPGESQENFKRVSDSHGVITIGKIKGGEKNSIDLAGYFVGPTGAVDDVSGVLRYVPERTSTRYEVHARSTTTITSSPVLIDINAPIEIVNGNAIDIAVAVKNTSNDTVSNLKVILDTPDSFTSHNTQPPPTNGNVWLIHEIAPHSEQVIHVRGGLNASIGTVQTFQVEVGTQESGATYVMYAQRKYSPRIISSPIAIKQEIHVDNEANDVVYAGEKLRYEISFVNNSDVPLRDAIVIVTFDTEVLDFARLELEKSGDYDAQNKRIIWKASDVEALKILRPNESGVVTFAVPVLSTLPAAGQNDNHFAITTLASIDSEDMPSELRENKTVLSNIMTLPVGAKVLFESNAAHKEEAKTLKIGEKTTYVITFEITNINNDIENVSVRAPLPTHVSFEGGDDGITFNERTNEVTWDIGSIVHGVGVTSDKIHKSFDVSIIPSVDQVSTTPILVKEQILIAQDPFANAQVHVVDEKITTQIQGGSRNESVVQP